MPNIKALDLKVSEMKNFEVGLLWCYIQNIKVLGLLISEKKNFENGLLCSYIQTCDPQVEPVLTPGHHMNKLGRGPQVDAIYQI